MLTVVFAISQNMDLTLVQESSRPMPEGYAPAPAVPGEEVMTSVPWMAEMAWIVRFPASAMAEFKCFEGSEALEQARAIASELAMRALVEAKGEAASAFNPKATLPATLMGSARAPFIVVRAEGLPCSIECATFASAIEWAKNKLRPALEKAFESQAFGLTGLRLGPDNRVEHDLSRRWGYFIFDEEKYPGEEVPKPFHWARALAFFESEELLGAAPGWASPSGEAQDEGCRAAGSKRTAKRKPRAL